MALAPVLLGGCTVMLSSCHPPFTMKVVLSASYLGIMSKPPPQILRDFSVQDFPYVLFRSVSVYIST